MFQDFAKRKTNDYLELLDFPDKKIQFEQLRHSPLPPFIISFLDNFIQDKNLPIEKKDFEEILRKALIFNINYLIRPKYSLLRFLFGDMETRPVEFIKERMKYFQFYGYYTGQIIDLIDINALQVVSSAQIEHIIDEINKKVYEEITGKNATDTDRLSLVKLLYYFFHDLGDNNPINIKLPRKILSVFFADKGYMQLKVRIDNFFSDEIFIQEAVELMNPLKKRSAKAKTQVEVTDDKVKEIVTKAKTGIINNESSTEEIEKILVLDEKLPEEIPQVNIKLIRENTPELQTKESEKLVIDEQIYSDDLVFAQNFAELTPKVKINEEEIQDKLINDLFCEETYRKKIIKKIFSKQEIKFRSLLDLVLKQENWGDASEILKNYFNTHKINFYTEEAVKFVDILQSHFVSESESNKAV